MIYDSYFLSTSSNSCHFLFLSARLFLSFPIIYWLEPGWMKLQDSSVIILEAHLVSWLLIGALSTFYLRAPWKIECFLEDQFLGSQWSIILGYRRLSVNICQGTSLRPSVFGIPSFYYLLLSLAFSLSLISLNGIVILSWILHWLDLTFRNWDQRSQMKMSPKIGNPTRRN